MHRCLGTRVFPDPLPARKVTFLVSDLHVNRVGDELLVAALDRILAAARAEPDTHRVMILGDLFEAYVGAGQLRLDGWDELRRVLRRTTDEGVPVAVIWGNRDFLLDRGFARATGCHVVKGGIWTTLGGVPAMLLHGDELCLNDVPYQKSKRWMRNAIVQWTFRRLRFSTRLKIGGKFREESRRSTAGGDAQRFAPVAEALDAVFATGAKRLVFGHIHRAGRGPWPPDGSQDLAPGAEPVGEYLVLPAFDPDLAAQGDPVAGCCLRAEEPVGGSPGGVVFWDPEQGAPQRDPGPGGFARLAMGGPNGGQSGGHSGNVAGRPLRSSGADG